jgi:hypothetical protein
MVLLGLLQFADFALTLLHPFKQWAMGTLGGLAFRLQGGLALLQLTQLRSLLLHSFRQSLLFPPAGGEGLSQFEKALPQWRRFIAITARTEAQSSSALGEAPACHGTAFFEQFPLKGDGPRPSQELPGAPQIREHLGVTEDIGEHIAIDRFVADQIDSTSHKASTTTLGASASGGGGTAARSPDLVERQEGESTGAATFEQINRTSRDAVVVHHHLAHPRAGSHFKSQTMAFIHFTKLCDVTVDAFQA